MSEENIVYIGNKPVMNYVLAVVTQINEEFQRYVSKLGKELLVDVWML